MKREVLIAGGTGYIGTRLVAALIARGHHVRVLARAASIDRVPAGAQAVIGNALDARSIEAALSGADTLIHLIGTAHPGPGKADEFVSVDLASARAAALAASRTSIAHFVYVSVAQPAPVMKAYVATRVEAENAIRATGVAATIVRPWYVLGPGHWWPIVLLPFYALARSIPPTRDTAERLGLVTLAQMVDALVRAVESPPGRDEVRIVDVPAIRGRTSG
ncbi:MAG: NAD(P)H-binding protein [Gemmatimonadota bacterium]|nr:NAD(P)H-binding protein [Gemmatimonadota bacterium]